MRVYLPFEKVDRSITRKRWKEIYRWKRIWIKRCREMEDDQIEFLRRNKQMPQRIRDDIMDHIINPPLLLGPLS